MRRLKLAGIIVALMLTTGCKTYYHAKFPTIHTPPKPKLENVSGLEMKKMSTKARKQVGDNFNKLIDYSRKMELSIDMYNSYADEQNEKLYPKKKDTDE